MSSNINTANQLFAWNKKNLVYHADLKKDKIATFFAPEFLVKANGKVITGNYDNYFEFLNQFRANIKSIEYELEEFVCNENKVVVPHKATIVRKDDSRELFDVILILGFNQDHKITLWHEVYTLSVQELEF